MNKHEKISADRCIGIFIGFVRLPKIVDDLKLVICPFIGGRYFNMNGNNKSPNKPFERKGICQFELKKLVNKRESGMPMTDAMAKALITIPIALPLLSYEKISATIEYNWAPNSPPKVPETILATNKVT